MEHLEGMVRVESGRGGGVRVESGRGHGWDLKPKPIPADWGDLAFTRSSSAWVSWRACRPRIAPCTTRLGWASGLGLGLGLGSLCAPHG